jgi:hypothetical protein
MRKIEKVTQPITEIEFPKLVAVHGRATLSVGNLLLSIGSSSQDGPQEEPGHPRGTVGSSNA